MYHHNGGEQSALSKSGNKSALDNKAMWNHMQTQDKRGKLTKEEILKQIDNSVSPTKSDRNAMFMPA